MDSECNCHITGAWLDSHDPGDRQFLKIGDLELESGEKLLDTTIAYQTWGKLNAAGDNAVLVNHAMTGWSDVQVGGLRWLALVCHLIPINISSSAQMLLADVRGVPDHRGLHLMENAGALDFQQ